MENPSQSVMDAKQGILERVMEKCDKDHNEAYNRFVSTERINNLTETVLKPHAAELESLAAMRAELNAHREAANEIEKSLEDKCHGLARSLGCPYFVSPRDDEEMIKLIKKKFYDELRELYHSDGPCPYEQLDKRKMLLREKIAKAATHDELVAVLNEVGL